MTALAAPMTRDFYLEVAKGNIPKHSLVSVHGKNDAVANGAWELIANLSGIYPWPQAVTTVRVKAGGNAADALAGIGAQSIIVAGLDINLAYIEQTIPLNANGTLASDSTPIALWRTLWAEVTGVGTYGGVNVGPIIIENTAGTADLLLISTGESRTQLCSYSVRAGITSYFIGDESHVDASQPSDVRICTRENLTNIIAPMSPHKTGLLEFGVDGQAQNQPKGPLGAFAPGTDIWIEASGSVGATRVTAAMEFMEVED